MTETRSFTGLVETVNQFIDDFHVPEPRAAYLFTEGAAVTLLFDGDGATANLISESLYWETNETGITTATVTFDGVHITAQIYQGADQ